MTTIVFLDRDGLAAHIELPAITTPSGKRASVVIYPTTSPAEVVNRLREADIAISNKVVIDQPILNACPQLKHIAVAATGYNNIDIAACHAQGISVSHIPSYANVSVPEHVIMLILALRRQLFAYRQHVAQGAWSDSPVFCLFKEPIKDLRHCVLGVVGFGQLGAATAELGHALGMHVIYTSRQAKTSAFATRVTLSELLQQSDVVSVHCDLNSSSANLIGSAEFAQMRRHAILINTARGGVVDEAAAAKAILTGQVAGLGIDVLTQEPPPNDHPLLQLAERPNVIITPHIAWASDAAMHALVNTLARNIECHLRGETSNLEC